MVPTALFDEVADTAAFDPCSIAIAELCTARVGARHDIAAARRARDATLADGQHPPHERVWWVGSVELAPDEAAFADTIHLFETNQPPVLP